MRAASKGNEHTVSVIIVRPIVAHLRSVGVDASGLLRAVRIDGALLNDSETRIPLARLRELWREAGEATGDIDIGLHVAEHFDATSLDVFSYIARSSATLGDALRRA